MKKILSFLLLFFIGIGFISCDYLATESSTTNSDTIEETTITTEEITSISSETTIEDTTIIPTTEETITEETVNRYVEINLYSMNDFHGGAYSGIDAMPYIGDYVKANQENSIYLTNGDMLQGSAISNYYYGLPLIDSLNEAGFDGFVIGNHEFDWGIEQILAYRDGNEENGELNHEILAANIVYEDTQMLLENTEPYIIKHIDGVDVGIIGLIGELENSISASRTENIEFLDPVITAATYADELRNDFDVEIVVVYIHNSSDINIELASLTGDERIDGIFNGHTHKDEAGVIDRNNTHLVYAQANNYDTWMVGINFVYDLMSEKIINASTTKLYESLFKNNYQPDSEITNILSLYQNDSEFINFINEELAYSQGTYSRYDLSEWGASVIRDYANVDIGAVNSGGFRVSMEAGIVTMEDMMMIYPFDNVIKTSKLTGQQLLDFYREIDDYGSDVIFDDGLVPIYDNYGDIETLEINGVQIRLDQLYTIGAVDYIFDKEYYDFLEGKDITITTYLMRDLLVQDLRNANENFNPYNGSNLDK